MEDVFDVCVEILQCACQRVSSMAFRERERERKRVTSLFAQHLRSTSGRPIPATNGCKMSMPMLPAKPQYLVRVLERVANTTTVQIEIDVEIESDQKEGLRSEE